MHSVEKPKSEKWRGVVAVVAIAVIIFGWLYGDRILEDFKSINQGNDSFFVIN